MKWSEEQITELKTLCYEGKMNNAQLAEHFGCFVADIYAKRSQLGITIPKCKAAQGKPGMTVNPDFEAAITEAEKTKFPANSKTLPASIRKAFTEIHNAVLLMMGSDWTSMRDAKLYFGLCHELSDLEEKYSIMFNAQESAAMP